MKPSIVPQLARMQALAGPGLCCVCLRPFRRTGKRHSVACWSADCQTEVSIIRGQFRRRRLRHALSALHRVVASLGWSTQVLSRLVER